MSDSFLERLLAAQSDEEREWLVLEFSLHRVTPAVREAVRVASIPHWFDSNFLNALLDRFGFGHSPEFESLVAFSFVELFPGRGHNIHDRTRTLLLNHFWREETNRYQELSARAADYCSRQNQDDTMWRLEKIYHLLIAEPEQGTSALRDTGWEWHNFPNFAYDKVEALVRVAREHAEAGRLSARGLGWTVFFEALLDFNYSRFKAALNKLLSIQVTPDDKDLDANCAWLLRDVRRALAGDDTTPEQYKTVLPTMNDEHILELASTAKWLESQGDIDAARDKIREAGKALVEEYRRYFKRLAWCTLPLDKKYPAEDIAEDVCLEASRSLRRFDERQGALKVWLIGIFWYCRVDALKRYERRTGLYPKSWETDPDKPNSIVEQRMNRLQDRERTILVMHVEGLTASEIAAVTRLTPENVRQIIHSGLRFLSLGV